MEFKQYIAQKKRLYVSFTNFLEASIDDDTNEFEILTQTVQAQKIFQDKEETSHFMNLLYNFNQNYHKEQEIINKIQRTLTFYKEEIKQTLSNIEVYEIFKANKQILLYLIDQKILIINKEITEKILNYIDLNGTIRCHFFMPEIKEIIPKEKFEMIENEVLNRNPDFYDDYEAKRQTGENDSYVCTLIRNDSVDEFVSYFTKENLTPSTLVPQSIFETNNFLIDNETTLFEYSAFFGSIQIFRFLYYNKAEITSDVWLCAIHSKNPELIHLLEEKSDELQDDLMNIYKLCLLESIKCNHNDLAYYIQNNLFEKRKFNINKMKDDVAEFALRYYNFAYIPNDYDFCEFYSICSNNYLKAVYIVLKNHKNEIIELSKKHKTKDKFSFYKSKGLTKIVIPPSIKSIPDEFFRLCKSLTSVSIPSTVKSIGAKAFSACKLLKEIKIPSSVKEIKSLAFNECISLTTVTIPSSVTSIEEEAFLNCTSLKTIFLPHFLKIINPRTFQGCISLKCIYIPLQVTSIEKEAFKYCTSLTKVSIPPSVTSIEKWAFENCYKLENLHFEPHSNLSYIGCSSFSNCCMSTIFIPSSVKIIDELAFYRCRFATQIIFEKTSKLTNINKKAFADCTSLVSANVPKSVKSIERDAFENCASLKL